MSELDFLVHQPAEWLRAEGPESEVVVSSRIRLARNISGFNFLHQMTAEDRKSLIGRVGDALRTSPTMKDALFLTGQMGEIDRQFLLERHLVSREHAGEKGEKAVAITRDETVSLMVLEEDHVRLQSFRSGFNLREAWRIANQIDDDLEQKLDYSFRSSLGYLTACPTNLGTGLRASCMLHLPSLVLTKQIHKVLQALSKLNLAARGLYGEGTQAVGNFFQFSNQMTLGQPEEEIIENLESVIRQVIEHEREARKYLQDKRRAKFDDQIWRAVGTLKSARIISSQEATQLLSLLYLGCVMGQIKTTLTRKEMNTLFLLTQPAHLQKLKGMTLNSSDRDIRRAELIRERLAKVEL